MLNLCVHYKLIIKYFENVNKFIALVVLLPDVNFFLMETTYIMTYIMLQTLYYIFYTSLFIYLLENYKDKNYFPNAPRLDKICYKIKFSWHFSNVERFPGEKLLDEKKKQMNHTQLE